MDSPLEPWLSGFAKALCVMRRSRFRRSKNSPGTRFATLGRDPLEAKSGYREEHYIWGLDAQQPLPIASNP
jgi:hypothetical protein